MRFAVLIFALWSSAVLAQNEEVADALQSALAASADLAATASGSQDPSVRYAAQNAQRALANAIEMVRNAPPYAPLPVMDAYTFGTFAEDLQRGRTTTERLALIAQVSKHHLILVDQLIWLMSLFSFSDEQIEIAATIYPHLADPENFHQAYAALSSDTLRRQLALRVARGDKRF